MKRSHGRAVCVMLCAAVLSARLLVASGSVEDQGSQASPGAGDMEAIVERSNALGVRLYRELKERDGNLVFSPIAIYHSLAMAYLGARGQTAEELAEVLDAPRDPEELARAVSQAVEELIADALGRPGEMKELRRACEGVYPEHFASTLALKLNVASSLWVQTYRRYHLAGPIARWLGEASRERVEPAWVSDEFLKVVEALSGAEVHWAEFESGRRLATGGVRSRRDAAPSSGRMPSWTACIVIAPAGDPVYSWDFDPQREDKAKLLRTLRDDESSAYDRRNAACVLGFLRCPEAFEPLMDLLDSHDVGLRHSAIRALGDLGDIRAVDPLIKALKDNGGWPSGFWSWSVPRSEDEPPRYTHFGAGRYLVRNACKAARSLGKIGDARAVPALLDVLTDIEGRFSLYPGDVSLRISAADALGKIGDRTAIPFLRKAYTDRHASLRQWAARAIVHIDAQNKTSEQLLSDLRSENCIVRYYAIYTLAEKGGETAVSRLEPLLSDHSVIRRDPGIPTIRETIGHAASKALERIRQRGALAEGDQAPLMQTRRSPPW